MKRSIILAIASVAAVALSGVSYLKGHRDGSIISELRSLSYELPALELLEVENNEDARNKLANLVELRLNWVTSGITTAESWSYWSGVDGKSIRDDVLPRTKDAISRIEKLEKEGYLMEEVNMNRLMAWLASKAGMQYFHNPHLNDPKYSVSGRMNDVVDPLAEIHELVKAYGLHVEVMNDTLYVWIPGQQTGSDMGVTDKSAEVAPPDGP